MSYDNANKGTLNHTREKRSERSPDFYGRIQISGEVLAALNEGKPIRLAGWMRDGKYGEFISLAAEVEKPREGYDWKAAEQKAHETNAQPSQDAIAGEFDDDIPF